MIATATDIIQQLTDLPPFPKVTARLLAMLEDDSVSSSQLASVLSSDPALTVKVIRMANSPFYMLSRRAESIQDAVLVLGTGTLKHLALAVSVHKGLSQFVPRSQQFEMNAYWKHSYASATAARRLARTGSPELADKMYLAGLIHDIGKLIQGFFWPEAWKAAVNLLKTSRQTFEAVEKTYFTLPHFEITTTLCKSWQFSDSIVELLQEMWDNSDEGTASIGAIQLSTANMIANAGGFIFPQEESCPDCDENGADFADMIDGLAEDVDHQLACLGLE
ncbi:MAG: HDOD domain-containing protein [Candidatus Zixiibacteriota bacterium]